jgi:hypothetical protein
MEGASAKVRDPASSSPRYYHAADRISITLALWLPLVGGLIALAAGTVYAFLAFLVHELDEPSWIVLVTPFFAVPLVWAATWICQLSEVRSRRFRLPIALCVGVMGLYAAWHAYLNFASDPNVFAPLPAWRMSPPRLWHAMRQLAAYRGASSWLLWLFEAATVLGFIVYLRSDEGDPEVPFCEQCRHWTSDALWFQLADGSNAQAIEAIQERDMAKLQSLGPRKSGAQSCFQVRVLLCPCQASRYVSLERVTTKPGTSSALRYGSITPGGRPKVHFNFGSGKSNKIQHLITNMEIDQQMQERLEKVHDHLKKDQ